MRSDSPSMDDTQPLLPGHLAGRVVLAKLFRALGDPTRLLLLEFVLHEERTVSECVEHVGLAQSRVSTHLACLADCGFVTVRREGRFVHYRVADPRVAEIVLLARVLSAENAGAVAECVRMAPVDRDPV
jgi:DNA-binding transcriptional ArsR family regulator